MSFIDFKRYKTRWGLTMTKFLKEPQITGNFENQCIWPHCDYCDAYKTCQDSWMFVQPCTKKQRLINKIRGKKNGMATIRKER